MVYDLRTYKIPNVICFFGIISGLLFNLILYGASGLKMSLFGMVCPVVMLYLMFLVKIVGAGDIKLLAGIGAFVTKKIIYVIIIAFVIASIYSFFYVLLKLGRIVRKKIKSHYSFSRMHLSVPIFLACIVNFIYNMALA
ncbi:MAG: prepilin peptidase [Lachnospiraceae bacterium]|nr:prepilin peptidase [Lachnospiraceae bacterium]